MTNLQQLFLQTRVDRQQANMRILSYVLPSYIVVSIFTWLVYKDPHYLHWFLVPIGLSGLIVLIDAVNWMTGRYDLFDPAGILGLFMAHFFFAAPLMHITYDYWMRYVIPPADWRDWLGWMAWVNFFGLVIYRVIRDFGFSIKSLPKRTMRWTINRRRFLIFVIGGLLLTGGLQMIVYAQSGGIVGYITAFEEGAAENFKGMGFVFMISESFPILFLMFWVVYTQEKKWSKSWLVIIAILGVYFILKLLFGGLRGSRSNTIWGLFWAAGMIHLWVRPMSKQFIAVALVFLISFMYIYGFYKAGGVEGIQALVEGGSAKEDLQSSHNRGLETTLLADLGRSDVQAYLLYRLNIPDNGFEYAYGRTYLGSAALLIPSSFWPGRPDTKLKEGTELQYGSIEDSPGQKFSSRIYGLTGEAMLNFGIFAASTSFIIFGVYVRRLRIWILTWEKGDSRLLILPFLINLSLLMLGSDSDNLVFVCIKNGAVPFMILYLASNKETVYHTALEQKEIRR
ncbi:hypothetical protein CIG75_18515 [Tumebacillus algifaecis]|uniref:O-antigen polysaccharide polymerase Wzy n=1 Tax=Tumebacillus algifaecis TaxID=1214604 RepID=A0A223D5T5_9BACL|nr:hypothetical protein [Tumebacillus algifaecis]ASS76734.1 hypothetical protein CIG75_18515 [Tumebacillus algifaecis]